MTVCIQASEVGGGWSGAPKQINQAMADTKFFFWNLSLGTINVFLHFSSYNKIELLVASVLNKGEGAFITFKFSEKLNFYVRALFNYFP